LSLKSHAIGAAGKIVQDSLDEDDANVDVAGDVREEFVEQIVDGVERIAGKDAGDGGGGVVMNAGNVLVRQDGVDWVVEQDRVVWHGGAVVVARDDGARDGVEDALGQWSIRHAEVARILMEDDREGEGSEELAGDILHIADADGFAEALKAGAVGGVGVGGDGDGGDADDGYKVSGVCKVMEGKVAFLLPAHWNDDIGAEKFLVGIDDVTAGFGNLAEVVGVEMDGFHGAEGVAALCAVASLLEG